jgi:hypothetical protein
VVSDTERLEWLRRAAKDADVIIGPVRGADELAMEWTVNGRLLTSIVPMSSGLRAAIDEGIQTDDWLGRPRATVPPDVGACDEKGTEL